MRTKVRGQWFKAMNRLIKGTFFFNLRKLYFSPRVMAFFFSIIVAVNFLEIIGAKGLAIAFGCVAIACNLD